LRNELIQDDCNRSDLRILTFPMENQMIAIRIEMIL